MFGFWTHAWNDKCPTGLAYTYSRIVIGWEEVASHKHQSANRSLARELSWRHSRHPSLTDNYGRPLAPAYIQPASNYALGVGEG